MDRKLTGIAIKPNGVQISFTFNHIRCREIIRVRSPTKTQLKEIVRKRDVILYEIDMGKFDYLSHFPNSKLGLRLADKTSLSTTISEMINDWFKRKQLHWENSTTQGYTSKVNTHILPIFGDIKVIDFKPNNYLDWAATAQNKNTNKELSGKSKNEIHSIMKAAFQLVFNNADIERNPFDRIERAKHIKKEPEPFNAKEREKILAQMTGQIRNLYEFAFWTGLRTGELLGLRKCDIDLDRKVIFVRRSIVKGKEKGTKTSSSARTHQLHEQALLVLMRQLDSVSDTHERIFLNPKTMLPWRDDRQIYNQCWVPSVKRSLVKFRKQYNTRHTYASTMLTENKPIAWVAKQLGHSDIGMTLRTYARWIS